MKVLGVQQILAKKYVLVEKLSPEMRAALGEIEDCFDCIIYGHSGNGKTSFTTALIKELSHLGAVDYYAYEEGHGKTVQDTVKRYNLAELDNPVKFIDHATYDEVVGRLKKKKSAKIAIIDSIQYTGFTRQQVIGIKEMFVKSRKRKIIIYISHERGGHPDGTVAGKIEYDANIKIHVQQYIAFIKSRYGSEKNYVIYEQGARGFWGNDFERMVNKGVKVKKPKVEKKPKKKEPVTLMQVLPEAEKPVFKEDLNEAI